ARWLEVELAALDGWASVGTVPDEAAREIRARAEVPTPERVAEIEERTQHDVAAFVDAVAEPPTSSTPHCRFRSGKRAR
ncbi:MAG: adenylosuccinate lyase, partial [Gaiellaceae bacterium]|nr:adenylosuccinate lyase [Gaiellaceae bacterium]